MVLVPILTAIQEAGLGISKSIPALMITSSTIDNMVAICGNSLFISIIFSNSSQPIWWIILLFFLQILLAIFYGVFSAACLFLVQIDHSV